MRNGIVGIIPKSPRVGPNSALSYGGRSRNGSRTLPLKMSTTTSVGDSGGTRHGEYK
jgi:hypothetical protein